MEAAEDWQEIRTGCYGQRERRKTSFLCDLAASVNSGHFLDVPKIEVALLFRVYARAPGKDAPSKGKIRELRFASSGASGSCT